MSYDDVLPPEPADDTRTAWETEHLTDPPDDAERFVVVQGKLLDPPPVDWRALAEQYRRERDYWRDRADACSDDLADLQQRYGVG